MKTKLIKQEGIGFQTINMSDYYLTLNGKIYHTNPLTLGMLTIEGKSGGTLSYKNCHEIYLNNPKFNEMDIEIEMETISEGLDESAQAQYTKVPKLDEDKCLIIKTTKTMKEKDLDYFKQNAEEDYMKTPISVLRYITELEQRLEEPNAKENWVTETSSGIYDGYRNKITGEWLTKSEYVRKFGPY